MRNEIFLHAADHIRDEYLESAARSMMAHRGRAPWQRAIAALAACLILCVGILIPVLTGDATLPITEHRAVGEALGGPIRLTKGERTLLDLSFGGKYAGLFEREASYVWYLTVEASVGELLPDVYEEPKTGERFRILRMETAEVISGEGFPEVFYFRIDETALGTLTDASRLILGTRQVGVERYPMLNTENNQMETFSLLFESADRMDHETLLPFRADGTGTGSAKGKTLDAVKKTLRAECEARLSAPARVFTLADFYGEETREALTRMTETEDAVYVQSVSTDAFGGKYISFTRYLNGFETSEQIAVFVGRDAEPTLDHLSPALTREQIGRAPALAPLIAALGQEPPTPPHTVGPERFETVYFSVCGWYTVSESGELRAVVKLLWHLSDGRFLYLDDLYLLVGEDGSTTRIEREALTALIGRDRHIENAEYNTPLTSLTPTDPTMPITLT